MHVKWHLIESRCSGIYSRKVKRKSSFLGPLIVTILYQNHVNFRQCLNHGNSCCISNLIQSSVQSLLQNLARSFKPRSVVQLCFDKSVNIWKMRENCFCVFGFVTYDSLVSWQRAAGEPSSFYLIILYIILAHMIQRPNLNSKLLPVLL